MLCLVRNSKSTFGLNDRRRVHKRCLQENKRNKSLKENDSIRTCFKNWDR
ncbi:MAG: hypothetical protein RLZZ198_1132 [Bacteroidota bacterium]